ncbi:MULTISPECIES: signal peptidase I [Enterococcus]|uniref:Signal peptidase I n=1 Tax=Candidatus Enterococcus murrayae TaxID=2815321 RepID=A0ABS3HNA9_9ENTE|nr:signal peptidase I [Enterococcus sp. MJM16]MBO0454487.1 signal peptidase I [Enterococcus sp. MJM16]
MRKRILWILNSLFWVLLLLIVASAAWFRFDDKTDKSIFGYRFYTVKTNSMKTDKSIKKRFEGETFEKGDLLIVKIITPSKVEVDDVVTFVPSGIEDGSIYLTHRVVSMNKEKKTLVTRGDANNMDDPEISAQQIIGIVNFAIPFIGTLLAIIQGSPYLSIGIAIAVILLFSLISKYFFSKA